MAWQIRVTKTAEKQLRRISKNDTKRIVDIIDGMVKNPFVGDIVKLGGEDNVWRRRVGNYRIKYRLLVDEKIIDIYDIERRSSNTY